MNGHKDFRLDVNALRAFAVMTVALYHFGVPGFSGGFIGVDVFFVISGYLMTRIALASSGDGWVSLFKFYLARARRIIPALVVLCLVLLVLGFMFLLPSDYRLLAKHVGASVGFFSNWVYRNESGYFDISSYDKWLLHTWSLSVEWQFYLVFPILVIGLRRMGLNYQGLLVAFIVIVMASFSCSVFLTDSQSTTAFYLLPSRAWEMLAGGIVCVLEMNRMSRRVQYSAWLAMLGLVSLFASVFALDHKYAWPGYLAAIPVLGTSLILGANATNTFLTRNAATQALGKWSYSIYLWHWPIVVALSYVHVSDEPLWKSGGLLISIGLGYLSFRWVENPTRRAFGGFSLVKSMAAFGVVLFAMAGIASGVFFLNGLEARDIPQTARIADLERSNRSRNPRNEDDCRGPKDGTLVNCIFGTGPIGAIVMGDSHAGALVTAVERAVADRGESVLYWGFPACPFLFGLHHINKQNQACEQFNRNILKALSSRYVDIPVVLVGRWAAYAHGPTPNEENPGKRFVYFEANETDQQFEQRFQQELISSVCKLTATGRRVFVVKPVPEMRVDVPGFIARVSMLTKRTQDVVLPYSAYLDRNRFVLSVLENAAQQCGVRLLDPAQQLCHADLCIGSIAGRPLYFDDDHLSEYGNKLLVPMFREISDLHR